MNPTSPAIILDHPQMGENIGAAARAMLNFGFHDLRLVAPRDGWPNQSAIDMSSGALDMMPPVQVFETLPAAIKDLHHVYATTARRRDMVKPVFTPRGAAADAQARLQSGQKTGLVFGRERTGLENDDLALCQAIITVPTNPEFSSINLAQSVLLVAYEWQMTQDNTPAYDLPAGSSFPAENAQLMELFERLENELETHNFFRSAGLKPTMVRNIRTLLTRAQMTDQEVRTFHGIISALTGAKKP